ncbi:threonine/serine exporter family protein [Terrisporobacter sp.]|uniref:threonine/serine exporter family protein n=1 Tax=Terrisporobacter sp. TaxID=1965305 RepID=UPI00261EAB12|nr:threonine/serine exporter family protein [Terrisporobacter sp.]
MTLNTLITNFIFSALATAGFSIFFNSPKRSLIPVGVIGGIGWTIYMILFDISENAILANFFAASFISLVSEILARKMKFPAIIFAIPGILPLIPGLGLYKTMLFLVEGNYTDAVSVGTNAVFVSASIAMGVLLITSLVNTYYIIRTKIINKKLQLKKLIK